ncbi:MATE family efflux transporter [Thermonema rossianum]|uniref:MATE family efflux transporter n=1 Tax=Thermonema rossianum TaxID=55505 RepID=UPI00068BD102|nr:MATE family efflux transporter [Thermonema rossianum]
MASGTKDKRPNHILYFDFIATVRLSIPIIVGQLGIVLMGVVDTAMIGRVGKEALAAAGVSNAVFFLIAILGIGLLNILSPMIAEAQARRIPQNLKALLVGGFWAATACALVLGSVMGVVIWHFDKLGQSPEVTALSREYMTILLSSLFPMYWFLCLRHFTDGMAMPHLSMYATLVGLLLNIFLNYLLIFGHWGLPALGLAGAAWATWGVRWAMTFILFFFLLRLPAFAFLKRHQVQMKACRQACLRIVTKGLGTGLQHFFEVATFALAAIMIGWVNDTQLAAHQIALNMASITYMISTGIAAAGAIRVGNALGRRQWHRVARAGTAALLAAIVVMTGGGVLFWLFPDFLASLYTREVEVLAVAVDLLLIAAFFQLSDGIQAVSLGILRGLQDVLYPTIATLIAYWVVALPVAYYLGIYKQMGAWGVWIGLLVGLTLAAVFLCVRFYLLLAVRKKRANKV